MNANGFSPLRRIHIAWRDSILLLREFAAPLFLFGLAFLGGGLLYYALARNTPSALASPAEGIYHALTLTFLQAVIDFPPEPYLQAFYFVMPLIGFVLLAQGVADFGALFFNRRTRGKEWAMAVASMHHQHVILVGLGHLGFQAMLNLNSIGQTIVVVEEDPHADLLAQAQALEVPVIVDDAGRETTLEAAGVRRARAILLCTQNDSLNLQIAVKARAMNPAIEVVVRIFDYDFATAIEKQFGFTALSASAISAPSFAAAAAGMEITHPITIQGQPMNLARLEVNSNCILADLPFGEIETRFDVSVVLWQHNAQTDFHPPALAHAAAGGTIAILGEMENIARVLEANKSRTRPKAARR